MRTASLFLLQSRKVACLIVCIVCLGWMTLALAAPPAPSAPKEVVSYKTPSYADAIWVANGRAYVASHDAGLIILGSVVKDKNRPGEKVASMSGEVCQEKNEAKRNPINSRSNLMGPIGSGG